MTDPPRRHSRARRAAPLAALLASLLLPACKGKDAGATSEPPPGATADGDTAAASGSTLSLPVTGALVRRGDLVLSIATTGQVRSEAVAQLKVETNGTVDEVLVRPGAVVTKGQVLVRLDPRPFDLAVREAQAVWGLSEIEFKCMLAEAHRAGSLALASARRCRCATTLAPTLRKCAYGLPSPASACVRSRPYL